MNNKCDVKGCNRDCFQETKQCILHCEKHTYSKDIENAPVLNDFYNALIDYIAKYIFDHTYIDQEVPSQEQVLEYLRLGSGTQDIIDFCSRETIVFNSVFFPCRDAKDTFDYLNVLNRLVGVYFNYCTFTALLLDIPNVKIFYQNCEFRQNWFIQNLTILRNGNNIAYQTCTFRGNVNIFSLGADEDFTTLDVSLFADCVFHKELSFKNMTFSKKIFNNSDYYETSIEALKIEQCVIHDDFILNNLNSRSVLIIDTEFKSKFEMKDSHINMMFETINTNFSGLFDVQFSNFAGFECFKCVFSNVASFEQCTFSVEDRHKEYMAIFKYTTFLSFASFRNSIFNLGLDLENANLKEAPNFLNIQLLSDNTNRETLRIIKNSFDKIGNHIDANDFFVKEMKKYKQELSCQGGNWQERIILWFNEKASDFGQSYIKPIVWMMLIAIFYSGLIYAQENDYLYRMYPPFNNVFSWLSQSINNIAKNIIPFKSFAKEGMEFLSLIFYIIFASLTWQTIVAFKRHTKR